ncbi:MAG: hypothetical protein WBP94_14480 [Rhodomicrobiaceae bacterium]
MLILVEKKLPLISDLGHQLVDEAGQFRFRHPYRGDRLDTKKHLIADEIGGLFWRYRRSFGAYGRTGCFHGADSICRRRSRVLFRSFSAKGKHLSKYPAED